MAEVYANVGTILARDKDLGAVLDEVAHELESYVIGLASAHVETGEFIASVAVTVDRSSPSRQDRFVYSDDPGALAIEFGHHLEGPDGQPGRWVDGLHIFGRAAEAMHGA